MALLNNGMRSLRGVNGALCALLVLAVTGCVLMQQLGLSDAPIAFSHAMHVDIGLECADCHAGPSDGEFAHADPVTCSMCHEDIDPDKPEELWAATIMAQAAAAREAREPLLAGLKFAHGPHLEADVGCDACHGDVAAAETLAPIVVSFGMDDCTSCHEQRGAPNECATCHSDLGLDTPPRTHTKAWNTRHGQVVRMESDATVDDCAMCHNETGCNECHKTEQPQSHTNTWRLRTHGVAAAMDRESCYVCHQTDSCIRCHEENTPLSHRANFGSPRNTHCLSCHFPVQETSCAVCHRSTPSHFSAAPLPGNHSPGLNCRQCHGVDPVAPLPHVDDGTACIACHK